MQLKCCTTAWTAAVKNNPCTNFIFLLTSAHLQPKEAKLDQSSFFWEALIRTAPFPGSEWWKDLSKPLQGRIVVVPGVMHTSAASERFDLYRKNWTEGKKGNRIRFLTFLPGLCNPNGLLRVALKALTVVQKFLTEGLWGIHWNIHYSVNPYESIPCSWRNMKSIYLSHDWNVKVNQIRARVPYLFMKVEILLHFNIDTKIHNSNKTQSIFLLDKIHTAGPAVRSDVKYCWSGSVLLFIIMFF